MSPIRSCRPTGGRVFHVSLVCHSDKQCVVVVFFLLFAFNQARCWLVNTPGVAAWQFERFLVFVLLGRRRWLAACVQHELLAALNDCVVFRFALTCCRRLHTKTKRGSVGKKRSVGVNVTWLLERQSTFFQCKSDKSAKSRPFILFWGKKVFFFFINASCHWAS